MELNYFNINHMLNIFLKNNEFDLHIKLKTNGLLFIFFFYIIYF